MFKIKVAKSHKSRKKTRKKKKNENMDGSNGSRKEMQKKHIPIATSLAEKVSIFDPFVVWYGLKFILFSDIDCAYISYM